MKTLLTLLAGLCLALVSAQLYPQKPGLLESTALRLGDQHFRNALRVNQEQSETLIAVFSSHGDKQRDLSQQMSKSTPEGYGAIQKKIEALESSTAKQAIAALTPGQKQRLWEVAIQTEGAFALRNADVAKRVGVSPEQKLKIEAIAKRTAGQSDELNAKMAIQLEKAKTEKQRTAIVASFEPKLKAIENRGAAEVTALLSKPQLAKWGKAKGAPFNL